MRKFAKFLHSLKQESRPERLKLCLMDQAGEALGSDIHALYLFDPATLRPSEILVRHLSDSFVFEYEDLKRSGERGYERLMHTRKTISDGTVYPGEAWRRSELYRLDKKYRMRRYLCAPILSGTQWIGMLCLGRRSDDAPFDGAAHLRADEVCRILSARLAGKPVGDSGLLGRNRETFLEAGRLRAERAFFRAHLEALTESAESLPAEEGAALWRSLAMNHSTPLDFFDLNGRRHVLLRAQETPLGFIGHRPLTPRERQVVDRAAAGDSNKVIAYDLGMSASTVASHLSSAMAKLQVNSRVRLVEAARGKSKTLRL